MSVLESSTERFVVRVAKNEFNFIVLKLNNKASDGWPDRLFLRPEGESFFIEFKRKGETPRKLQEFRIANLLSMGHTVYVVDNAEEGINVLRYEKGNRMGATPISRKSCGDYDFTGRSRSPHGPRTGED